MLLLGMLLVGMPTVPRPDAPSTAALPPLSASWVVAVDPSSPVQEQWAALQVATQLGLWLGTTSGPLPVVAPAAAAARPAIVIGATAAVGVVPPGTLQGLGPEAFWCGQSSGSSSSSSALPPRLYLTGGLDASGDPEPRGTVNGAFEYLRACGFRWCRLSLSGS
jgi:hypothetical protein